MPIVAEHSSGRFDVTPGDLKAALTKQLADGPDVLSLTEMGAEDRARVLNDFPEYAVARAKGTDGDDECALLVKRDHYKIVSERAVRLSSLPVPRRSRGRKIFDHALVVELESLRTGSFHTRIVVHRPSAVEGRFGIKRGGQGACYRDGTEGLKKLIASVDGRLIVTGDWNLSLRRRWVNRYLNKHFPGFARTWTTATLPDKGTRGGRVIDFSLLRGYSVSGAEVIRQFGASDHRAFRETLEKIG
jgi:hypothetical protein